MAKQLELQSQCLHPSGEWRPLNWRQPEQSIPDRIAAVAQEFPDRLAVFGVEPTLTYADLDRAANGVANAILAARGVSQEVVDFQEVVALLVGVDTTAVIASLGVLKAGKVFTALAESFPQSRAKHILEDAAVRLILTDGAHLSQAQLLAGARRKVINLDRLPKADESAPGIATPLDSLAILNYTSGSTGVPKGVVQSHRSAFAHSVRFFSIMHLSDADRVTCLTELAWAGSFWIQFGPLCFGASIGPFDVRQRGLQPLGQWLLDTEATLLASTVVTRQFVQADVKRCFPSVRLVSLAGDTIYRWDVEACLRAFPEAMVATGLGLSEAGRVSFYFIDSREMLDQEIVPLGLPAPGVRLTLLSDEGREVAPGEVGEIVVESEHLAAGYWNRPELTVERFRPAGELGDGPTYLTSDLGRRRPDGLLVHKGRKDFMVKIRGYQVFTNEIEALLLNVAGVREVSVKAQSLPAGDQRLAAYLVVDDDTFAGMPALHSAFAEQPRHMRPAAFVLLDELPKNANSKVDRHRLPLPEQSRLNVTANYVTPRNPTETILAAIWGEVLGIDGVGVADDFLELGGNSLQSGRIINKVLERFDVEISYQEFMQAMTIAEMAAIIPAQTGDFGTQQQSNGPP